MLSFSFQSLILPIVLVIYLIKQNGATKRPNILLLVADDLGWNDVGFTGNQFISTPNIDTLAKEGVLLTNYYVSPICSPSRSALLTGYHPIHTGMQHNVIASDEPWGLPKSFKILPQYLKSLNYSTHLVGKWHQGFYSKQLIPTERGFDTFNGYLSGATDYYDRITRYESQWGLDWYENAIPSAFKYAFNYSTDILTDQTIKLIQSQSNVEQPWLIVVAYQAVHIANSPKLYQVPVDYLNRFNFIEDINLRSYVALLASLDDSIGTIFNQLHKSGQSNSTLIVFTSDNGAPTGSLNGKNCNLGLGSNQPLRGSKYTLWEGGIKGLSWVWANWFQSKGTLYNGLSHITDWMPTLYSFAGGDESSLPANIDGINLRYALENNWKPNVSSFLRNELLHNIDDIWQVSAIRIGDYKLVSGTVFDGQFDDWVSRNITIDKHLLNNSSPSLKLSSSSAFTLNQSLYELDRKSIKRENKIIEIDCLNQTQTDCSPVKEPCLFNVKLDPCELNNIASSNQQIVESMLKRLDEIRKTAVQPVYHPGDPLSAPIHHNGYWTWWLP